MDYKKYIKDQIVELKEKIKKGENNKNQNADQLQGWKNSLAYLLDT